MLPLTPYQEKLINLKCQGLTNPKIAKQVKNSRDSVKHALNLAYKNLGLELKPTDNRELRAARIAHAFIAYKKEKEEKSTSASA